MRAQACPHLAGHLAAQLPAPSSLVPPRALGKVTSSLDFWGLEGSMELSGWPASPPEKQMGSRSSWAPGLTQANSTHTVWTVNGVGQGPKEMDGLMDEESSAEARPSQGWHRGQAERGGEADWPPDRVAGSPGRRLCGGALGPPGQPL